MRMNMMEPSSDSEDKTDGGGHTLVVSQHLRYISSSRMHPGVDERRRPIGKCQPSGQNKKIQG